MHSLNPTWPDSKTFWRDKRVTVTGGAGFLGSFVVEKLRVRGAGDIFVPRKRDYDLVQREAVLELLHDARPDLIIHLAASVGGIGANLVHQAEYFYENSSLRQVQDRPDDERAGVGGVERSRGGDRQGDLGRAGDGWQGVWRHSSADPCHQRAIDRA